MDQFNINMREVSYFLKKRSPGEEELIFIYTIQNITTNKKKNSKMSNTNLRNFELIILSIQTLSFFDVSI